MRFLQGTERRHPGGKEGHLGVLGLAQGFGVGFPAELADIETQGLAHFVKHGGGGRRGRNEVLSHSGGLGALARKNGDLHTLKLTRGYPSRGVIETFPNPKPGRPFVIRHECPEFTSVCPKTGQPDFATIILTYIPNETCIELKSLKLYYYSFRNEGIYYEAVVNRLLDELAASCQPQYMRVTGHFNVRGGIGSVVYAETGPAPEGIFTNA